MIIEWCVSNAYAPYEPCPDYCRSPGQFDVAIHRRRNSAWRSRRLRRATYHVSFNGTSFNPTCLSRLLHGISDSRCVLRPVTTLTLLGKKSMTCFFSFQYQHPFLMPPSVLPPHVYSYYPGYGMPHAHPAYPLPAGGDMNFYENYMGKQVEC